MITKKHRHNDIVPYKESNDFVESNHQKVIGSCQLRGCLLVANKPKRLHETQTHIADRNVSISRIGRQLKWEFCLGKLHMIPGE